MRGSALDQGATKADLSWDYKKGLLQPLDPKYQVALPSATSASAAASTESSTRRSGRKTAGVKAKRWEGEEEDVQQRKRAKKNASRPTGSSILVQRLKERLDPQASFQEFFVWALSLPLLSPVCVTT